MLAIILIILGISLRFFPHSPNFTPVAAIALFAGAYLPKKWAVAVPLALMIISDMFLGMHNVVFFTWGGFALVSVVGFMLRGRKTVTGILGTSLISSVIFYIVSNFGVWFAGWYPRTSAGLLECYIMGLPFLRDFTLATLFYALSLFAAYELVAYFVKDKKIAGVLLK